MMLNRRSRPILFACYAALAKSQTTITTTSECDACQSAGNRSCRSPYYDAQAFCCDEAGGCSAGDAICSSRHLSHPMNAFACPFSASHCGTDSSRIEMHPETKSRLEVEQSIDDAEVCYYQILVDEGNLDTQNNRYEWQVTFSSLTNVIPVLIYGKTLSNMEDGFEHIKDSDTI